MSSLTLSKLTFELKLSRTTPSFSRSPLSRPSLAFPSIRYQSNGGEEKVKGQVIGIDLGQSFHTLLHSRIGLTNGCPGTTNSAVAILEGKTPKIIENAEGML